MGNKSSSLVDISNFNFDPEYVYIIVYHYDLTSNIAVNSISNSIMHSMSGIEHISSCSIVCFGKEYQFGRCGVMTAYDPGHLSTNVLRQPLRIQNMNRSKTEWTSWLELQQKTNYNSETFNYVDNNWNHFVKDATHFFGYDITSHSEFLEILREGQQNKEKLKRGALKGTILASTASEVVSNNVGQPSLTVIPRTGRQILHGFEAIDPNFKI